jgi:hypothetical protein
MVDTNFAQAVPLIEYAKGLPEGTMERAFVETFAAESDVAAVFPMMPATNGLYKFRRTASLPTVAFRGYNEPGNQSSGTTTRHTEGVFLQDEYIRVDRAEVDELGEMERVKQERMKIIAMSRNFTNVLLQGDNSSEPREPNGLQARCNTLGATLIHNSASSGGGALSLGKLDEAIEMVNRPSHIIATRTLRPKFTAAARSPTLTNSTIILDDKDPLGRKVMSYNGLPILWGYEPDDGADILPFAEVGSGGGSAVTSSIYVASLGRERFFGIEGVPLKVTDEGQVQGVPVLSTHVKWDIGFVFEHPRSAARLTSITNAAIVA